MTDNVEFLNLKLKNRSVLPSGILGVSISSLKRVYHNGAGAVTTKSIGPSRRKGHRSPVVYDWGMGLINAVGLSNPGVEGFVKQYSNQMVDFPVIISVFGETEQDFPMLAQKISHLKYAFLELNLSCPNVADEFGKPFAFSARVTGGIVKKVKYATDKPVIVKLSPNTPELIDVAKEAANAGADALCIMNTAGPGMVIDTCTAAPVLGNLTGGVSGDAVLPITVKNVYQVYKQVPIPIIATGGISDLDGALQVLMAGASLYGIGSAVYTMGIDIFQTVSDQLEEFMYNHGVAASGELIGLAHQGKKIYMPSTLKKKQSTLHQFQVAVVEHTYLPHQQSFCRAGEIKTIFFNREHLKAPEPGQFFMLWLPGVDQKPYSVSYLDDRMIGFSFNRRGAFSDALFELAPGDPVGLLGPLGRGFDMHHSSYLLVGGGVGLAPLVYAASRLAKEGKKTVVLAAGAAKKAVVWAERLMERLGILGEVKLLFCTEDGSVGYKGIATEYLPGVIDRAKPHFSLVCGPEKMILGAMSICKKKHIPGQASIERMMKCGIGICGSCCVDHTGDRVCVEGPVFSYDYLEKLSEFGKYTRDESGTIQLIE
ncbi:MAG: dihydroorotate dehydrogenase [Spirochaetota bacterium]